MKRVLFVIIMLVLVCVIVFISIPQTVQAGNTVSTHSIAAGDWNTGTAIEVDLSAAPSPEWLQLMTVNGVVVNEPTEICHELGGGKFHWIGEIRKLTDGRWTKLQTTTKWVPDEEGLLMACAQAPIEGTYALFGFYNGPQESFPILPVPTDGPTVTPTLVPTQTPSATETPSATPTAVGTPVSCGVHKIIVEGLCVCEPGYTLNKGICSQKQQ